MSAQSSPASPLPAHGLLRSVIDAIPSMVFIVDEHAQILDANSAAVALLGEKNTLVFRRLCGDVLFCVHARDAKDGCGSTENCKTCQVRQGAAWVVGGGKIHRRLQRMRLDLGGREQGFAFFVSAAPLQHEGRTLAMLILEDVTELTELREIVPICSHCKKIRDDKEFWESVEGYLSRNARIQLSHGICPECLSTLYPEMD